MSINSLIVTNTANIIQGQIKFEGKKDIKEIRCIVVSLSWRYCMYNDCLDWEKSFVMFQTF